MERIAAYRLLAERLLRYAVRGPLGRDEQDPVYREVTEERDPGPGYSSCGDLPHWMLYRLGVRESWVNRQEHFPKFRYGKNISTLSWKPCPSREMHIAEKFACGDTLIIWAEPDTEDAHALVVLEHDVDTILSADYGQPGGKLVRRRLSDRNLGGRYIQRVLTLGMALSGGLAPPDWTYIEAMPAPYGLSGEELDAVAAAIGWPLPARMEAR